MNLSSNLRNPGPRAAAPRLRGQRITPSNPQLFDDTSMPQNAPGYGYPPSGNDYNAGHSYAPTNDYPPTQYTDHAATTAGPYGGSTGPYGFPVSNLPFAGQQLLNDPVANMAVQYGQSLAGHSTQYIHKNIEKYVATSKLKYYFAVDTSYVGRKLGLVVFPFAHSDWSLRYNQDEPVAPRYDINAPDLYIPVMAFVTYILLTGVVLGTQNRFSPEQLGITSSSALVWTIIEILLLLLTMYIMNVTTDLKCLDLISYCGYKYVGMIVILSASLLFHSTGYYVALAWMSLSIAFFLVRSMKLAIIPHADPDSYSHGNKRRLYMLLIVALAQPALMWWLTRHLTTTA